MRDLPTIALFRPVLLLRRSGPVPGILAAGRAGAIVDKSNLRFEHGVSKKPNNKASLFNLASSRSSDLVSENVLAIIA